jgi:hypothetical protein
VYRGNTIQREGRKIKSDGEMKVQENYVLDSYKMMSVTGLSKYTRIVNGKEFGRNP